MEDISKYPLTWPAQQGRTPDAKRAQARFGKRSSNGYGLQKLTLAQALKRLMDEITKFTRVGRVHRIDPKAVIVSSNVELRLDGLPYSGRRAPTDPGVALYFKLDDDDYCLPCDSWDRVEDNLAAIAGHLSAMRAMDRWGVGNVRTHFAGFKALPSPDQVVRAMSWDQVLGVNPNSKLAHVKQEWRKASSAAHPDNGGNADLFDVIQKAWAQAQEALK